MQGSFKESQLNGQPFNGLGGLVDVYPLKLPIGTIVAGQGVGKTMLRHVKLCFRSSSSMHA